MKTTIALFALAAGVVACAEAVDPPGLPSVRSSAGQGNGNVPTTGDSDNSSPSPTGGPVTGGGDDGTGPTTNNPTPTKPDSGAAPVAATAIATNVAIAAIDVYQAVKIPIVKDGNQVSIDSRNAGLVSNREALVRVTVTPDSGYGGQAITAELHLSNGSGAPTVLTDSKVVPATASDATLSTTFNFDVPPATFAAGTTYSVVLVDPAGAPGAKGAAGAKYPADGSAEDFGIESTGGQVKVVLVPFQYGADGSNRLPDTSAAQLEIYRSTMMGMYPTQKIDISVHAPYAWSQTISADGTGFDTALDSLVSLRAKDKPAKDVYYFGIFAPMASFNTYCRGGCVMGLSGVGSSPNDANVRASVGAGFTGSEAAETAAHEIAHAHGRQHAPCGGAAGPDPNFPYSGGAIGSWGYDLNAKKLIDPGKSKDFMGYCSPTWISDYNYQALFDRIKFVNGANALGFAEPKPYRMIHVARDGSLAFRDTLALDSEPSAESRDVTFLDSAGNTISTVTGHFYAYDHLGGGYLLVPDAGNRVASARVAGFSGLAK